MKKLLSFLLAISPLFGAEIKLTPFISEGLDAPVLITPSPTESNKQFVVEQKGTIRIVTDGKLERNPYLNIENEIVSGGETGLLGMAFHPKFSENGKYYIYYTIKKNGLRSTLAEVNTKQATRKIILDYEQKYSNHVGGNLVFDKNGYLYLSLGDGGSAGDPHDLGQNLNSLRGKILRLDVDGAFPYAIPKDNPFIQKGRSEIFAYGLRNAWRFSFDRVTGILFAGDVGQDSWEEIDIVEKGGNYGWSTMEGNHCFKPTTDCKQQGLTLPIYEYPRNQGISVTGGYVYRGSKIPNLNGVYVYGDYGSGKIWGLTYDFNNKKFVKNELLLNSRLPISSFGEDNQGELWVVSYDGRVFKMESK